MTVYWKEQEWMKQRREALLGVTSYSATYAYLYLEPREIRFEILVPLLTLETWLPLQREEADYLSVAEQDAMEKGSSWFSAGGLSHTYRWDGDHSPTRSSRFLHSGYSGFCEETGA